MSSIDEACKADLVFVNGRIVTVDEEFSVAEAIAVKDGLIKVVGSRAEVEPWIGGGTEVVDLEGGMVLPGLIDSHIHVTGTGALLQNVVCSTPPVQSIADIADAVRMRIEKAEPGEWITGRGWDQVKLSDHRNPTRWDLDHVSPDNPVFLKRTCGHVAVVNSRALEIAGVTGDTPHPVGGRVEFRDGEPTGILEESPAMGLVSRYMPAGDFEDTVNSIKTAVKALNRDGITSVIDAGVTATTMRAYQQARREGGLTLRVNYMLSGRLAGETGDESAKRIGNFPMSTSYGDNLLRFLGLKLLIDGGIGGRTALLREPYEGDLENRGILTMPVEDIQKRVDAANMAGMMVGIHCAGGGAIDTVIDAFVETDKISSIAGRRYCLIHAYQPTEETFQRCRELELVVASQPSFLYYLGDSYHENVGDDRSRWLKPHRAWIDHGVVVAAGTDSPVTPYPPFPCLWAAVARRTEVNDIQMGTEQAVSREEAIRMYTINGAYHTFEEDIKGSLEPEKLADMIIIDRDILTCPLDEVKDTQVLRTVLEGKTVYKA